MGGRKIASAVYIIVNLKYKNFNLNKVFRFIDSFGKMFLRKEKVCKISTTGKSTFSFLFFYVFWIMEPVTGYKYA